MESTRRSFLIALGAVPRLVAKSWQEPAFPNWEPEHVDRLLTDSPWAQQLTVPFRLAPAAGQPGGGARTEVYLTVRWSSALPIRQALALLEFGRDGLSDARAVEALTREEPDYVVDIAGFPATMAAASEIERDLARNARLFVRGRRAVSATSVHVPEYGMHLSATLRFPRFQGLSEGEGSIQLLAEAATAKLEQSFKLKAMVYRGRLEL